MIYETTFIKINLEDTKEIITYWRLDIKSCGLQERKHFKSLDSLNEYIRKNETTR